MNEDKISQAQARLQQIILEEQPGKTADAQEKCKLIDYVNLEQVTRRGAEVATAMIIAQLHVTDHLIKYPQLLPEDLKQKINQAQVNRAQVNLDAIDLKHKQPGNHPEDLARTAIELCFNPVEQFLRLLRADWWEKSCMFFIVMLTIVGIIAGKLHPLVLIGELTIISLLSQFSNFSSSALSSPTAQLVSSNEQESLGFRIYRQAELVRTRAALLANSAILIVGEEGCGKTVLANAVVENLQFEGFIVALVEPATSKQMCVQICEQLNIPTETLEGKFLTIKKMQLAIADFFKENTAFLAIDDAQRCELKFRLWLKELRGKNVPMLLLATAPPRSDIFIKMPRLELKPLSEYAIREIMQQAALERGIDLRSADFAKLQQRVGGNPVLAIRAIEEEYLGVEMEGGDHQRYGDATPIILFAGTTFVIIRFIGLGTNQFNLYLFASIAASLFLAISRLMYHLPKENKRIG
jgi:predicted ATPase